MAITASSVLPAATAIAVHGGALVATLTANAASQIAGHRRDPQMSRLATAIPVGAQTVVTCSATNAARKPTSAAATYAVAIAAPISTVRNVEIPGGSGLTGTAALMKAESAVRNRDSVTRVRHRPVEADAPTVELAATVW